VAFRRGLIVAGLAAGLSLAPAANSAEAVQVASVMQTVPSSGPKTQTGRLFRDGTASACEGVLKVSPTLESSSTSTAFHYIDHTFSSSLTNPICVTADLQTACTGSNTIFSVAYAGTFDPANPLTRYAADLGGSNGVTSYSFNVGSEAFFSIVVHEIQANTGCSNYTLTVSSRGPWATAKPSIGGTPAVGTSITGTDAVWKATPTIHRRWRRCDPAGANCVDIPGATAVNYTVTDADLGHTLRFANDATDVDGTSTSESGPVEPFIPFETRPTESLGVGDRVENGFFVRNSIESRCGAPTSAPTILQPTDSFLYDTFSVGTLLNEPICLVARTRPMCTGGITLAIYNPAFAPTSGIGANYAGNSGTGFTSEAAVSVTLPPAGNREVVVNRGNTGGSCAQYALTLGADSPYATARPAVGGTAMEGGTLTASDGTWSGTPAFGHSWLRCGGDGAACAAIENATAASYKPAAGDVGHRLRVRVTATQGRSVSSDSDPTGIVAAAPPGGGGTPAVDRTPPKATLRLASRNLAKLLKSKRLPLTVTCDERCSAVVEVRITSKLAKKLKLGKKVVIARAKGGVAARKKTTLRAKLVSPARRALAKRRSLSVGVAGTFTDAAGNKARRSLKGSLRRP
jgi:hypothetical protein